MGMQIPLSTAVRYLVTSAGDCALRKAAAVAGAGGVRQPVSVIVPVTNEAQLGLNVLKSPGLREINAEVIAVRHAASAAEAYAQGAQEASHAWRLFCHQDVYFPEGHGEGDDGGTLVGGGGVAAESNVMGFVGMAVGDGVPRRASGIVVDRINAWIFAATEQAISVDELCVAIHRDLRYRIDPELGWHLWATDLCLQPLLDPDARRFTHVARVPLFHNSASDWTLPESYRESEKRCWRSILSCR